MNRFLLLFLALPLAAQTTKTEVVTRLESGKARYDEIALKLWNYAETGFKEFKSSQLLQETLRTEGFAVESGVASMPTAFVATYGRGNPVIAILGEFDALPGVSQEAVAERKERAGFSAGHACGHNLFGAGSLQAAVAVKDWLRATGHAGTVRFYGTPAEEGGAGKAYMVRAGLFNDVDVVLHWHADSKNVVRMTGSLANLSAKFRFRGVAAHASAAPERGRSALDGVEAMNHMVNLMREHVPDTMRIHYVITRGGEAPNVVPAFAEVYYYVRSPSRDILKDVWARVEDAARGAALGTGTTVDWELIHGAYELLLNDTLGRVMHENLLVVGGVTYDAAEKDFAMKIGRTLYGKAPASETVAMILPFVGEQPAAASGSTDVGDVSWIAPTVGLRAATWAPGVPSHSWQAVACGGMSIGLKGMAVAAKTMALTAIDLYLKPEVVAQAKAEFNQRRGAEFKYTALIGDRAPPLDYRD